MSLEQKTYHVSVIAMSNLKRLANSMRNSSSPGSYHGRELDIILDNIMENNK